MKTMQDRVAVITGAGSGIGRALALAFASEGCRVVLADIEQDALMESERLAQTHGGETLALQTDVTDAAAVEELANATLARFDAVNILCNNAGVGGGGLIKNCQLVDWKWVIDVSLWGVIHGLQSFLPHLVRSNDAHVVSTGSVAGLMATPGLGPYNAAKYGVVAIMETLYLEMVQDKANVGVSVLCPGEVNTNIASAQRNRPAHLQRERKEKRASNDEAKKRNAVIAATLASGMDPGDVAALVIDAIYHDKFWILSHPTYLEDIQHRNESLRQLENPSLLRPMFKE